MAKRKRKKKTDLGPLDTMIDIAGAAAMGAYVKHKNKQEYKNGHGEESIRAATMVYGHGAMRRGSAGRIALGGLYGVNSAIKDIERQEAQNRQSIQARQVAHRAYDDGISLSSYKTNDNRYAWRLNCEDGSAYGIYPKDFETREAFNKAIQRAKEDSGSVNEQYATESCEDNDPTYDDITDDMVEYTYCRVSRLDNGINMYYLANRVDYKIGEMVIVPGEFGEEVKAVILSIEKHTMLTAPQPPSTSSYIISKVDY